MKFGIVTYQIAQDWDMPTLIDMCQKTGLQGVELRTTHAHKVEADLTPEQRREVKKQFEDAGIEIVGLGTIFEYHAVEPEVVRQNIDGTIEYAQLAADIGCGGVKVRPNGLQVDKGIPVEKTLEQIGLSVRECAEPASDLGVQIRVEVHGPETSDPKHMRSIMDYADHANASLCWNSSGGDIVDGSVKESFELLKDKLTLIHLHEIYSSEYPYQELFSLLKAADYDGYTLAEIAPSPEPERLLSYYKALWEGYTA